MQYSEFQRPVSVDFVPEGSVCEWCGKPAERRLTAIGGRHHNEHGSFCRPCGEQFTQTVTTALNTAKTARWERE